MSLCLSAGLPGFIQFNLIDNVREVSITRIMWVQGSLESVIVVLVYQFPVTWRPGVCAL